jgi:AraC-like DNA-binding protein
MLVGFTWPNNAAARTEHAQPLVGRSAGRFASLASRTQVLGGIAEVIASERVTEGSIADDSQTHIWTSTKEFDDFARVCCGRSHLRLLTDPDEFSLTQRIGRMGPVALSEVLVEADLPMDCGDACGSYRILVVQTGRTRVIHGGLWVIGGPGSAAVYSPEGLGTGKWDAGTRIVCFKINRSAVDDVLSEALGRRVTPQIDFNPVMPINSAPTRSWIDLLMSFKDQFFRPDSLVKQPLVGMPLVDSLVRGLLFAAEHPYLGSLHGDKQQIEPRAIRTAIEIIEEEAHLPLTLSAIASRTHVSVRTLQQGFQRHVGISPMAYLREVRLHHAHQNLLDSDPFTVTVASVAHRWGFTNLGRFAAAHAARYHEPPVKTLRRSA